MKNLLFRFAIFAILTLFVAAGIFWWSNDSPVFPQVFEQAKSLIDSSPETSDDEGNVITTFKSEIFTIPEGGIKLSSLALGESQKKALETAGINIETFVVTETMLACSVEKLGDARSSKIFAGDSPSLLEIGKLLPCLRR